jgi:hypothetical protein
MHRSRAVFRAAGLTVAAIVSLAAQSASAAALQLEIESRQSGFGPSDIGFSLFLNGDPLPNVASQTLDVAVGDTLRVEVSASAASDFVQSVSGSQDIDLTLSLLPGADAASVRTVFSGSVDTIGESSTGQATSSYTCRTFIEACEIPDTLEPNQVGIIGAAVSDALSRNTVTIGRDFTETGRIGGPESVEGADFSFDIARDVAAIETPSVGFNVRAAANVAGIGTASGASTLEVTVVPLPAGVWLLGSALAGLSLVRRRLTGRAD